MSEHRDDPDFTAWALGEASDRPRDEHELSERARVEQLAALGRDVLRADGVPDLDTAQRVEIMRRAERRRPRSFVTMLVAASFVVLVAMSAVYLALVRPAEQRAIVAERARVAAEAAARAAEVQARQEAVEREAALARARALAEMAEHSRAQAEGAASRATMADVERQDPAGSAHDRSRPATKASGSSTSSGSASGGCDPNDPLCGL